MNLIYQRSMVAPISLSISFLLRPLNDAERNTLSFFEIRMKLEIQPAINVEDT